MNRSGSPTGHKKRKKEERENEKCSKPANPYQIKKMHGEESP